MLKGQDRHLRRTPLHIAARQHGRHSPVYQELLALERLVFDESTEEVPSSILEDDFGFTAQAYAQCTTASLGCPVSTTDTAQNNGVEPHVELQNNVMNLDGWGGWKVSCRISNLCILLLELRPF